MEHEGNRYNEELEKLIKTLEETYDELSIEIEKNQRLAHKLGENKNEYETEIQELKSSYHSKTAKMDKRIKELEMKVKKIQKEKEVYKNRYTAIKNSSLWKMMYPLRKILDMVKGIKGRIIRNKENENQHSMSPISSTIEVEKEPKDSQQKKAPRDIASKVEVLKKQLYELGFTEQALKELRSLYNTASTANEKCIIGWELLVWYANQGDKESAREALEVIPAISSHESSADRLRRVAILEAECEKILDNTKKAKEIIQHEMEKNPHSDLYLAASRLETSATQRLAWINELMTSCGLLNVILASENEQKTLFDSLQINPEAKEMSSQKKSEKSITPKVSVIVPVFNSKEVIQTALKSILTQTWRNLEIIIADDHSDDNTLSVIQNFANQDSRIKVIQTNKNSGTYIARNIALKEATGDFITCHDADDWSHPEKIEIQVRHLLENPKVVANTSEWARATNELLFHRKGALGIYLTSNMSSLMFRREQVMEKLGFWDPVRFSADYEFITRIIKEFGQGSFVKLKTGLLSIGRESEGSLTSNSKFGFYGFMLYGVRKEYVESFKYYQEHSDSLRYDFPQAKRLFPVPTPMLPERKSCSNHYKLMIGSDFRVHGSTTLKDIEMLKNFKDKVYNMGIFQMSVYGLNPSIVMPEVRDLLDDKMRMVVYGEKVSCDLLILKHSDILKYKQVYIPEIEAGKIIVIIDKPLGTKQRELEKDNFDIEGCHKNLNDYFGKGAKWYPMDSAIRQSLTENKEHQLNDIQLQDQDWVDLKGGIAI